MNAIDDPTVPDDLRDLLQGAAADQAVSPAPIGSVQHRARQRRRRRRALATCGTAAVLLLAGLAIAQTVIDDGPEQVETATVPAEGSVPQPMLLFGGWLEEPNRETGEPSGSGTWLDEVSPSGSAHWWRSDPGFQGIQGVVLADGRRFGIALEENRPGSAATVRLDEIGANHRSGRSIDIGADPDDAIRLLGASGTEVVLSRTTTTVGETDAEGRTFFTETSVIEALDVDTGETRKIDDLEGGGFGAAAADRVITSTGTDCTLEVRTLDGTGDPHTVSGACPAGPVGDFGPGALDGMANAMALSPDGRHAAVVWNMIRTEGATVYALTLIDLDTGQVDHTIDVSASWPVSDIAWTGDRTLTVAVGEGLPALPATAGDIAIVTVEDLEGT